MSKENNLVPELRFPEFNNEGEWQKKPLEEILNFQTGYPFDSEGFNEDGRGIRLIKNRDLKSDDKLVHYSKPYDEKYLITDGDVLVGMDGDFTPVKWNKGTALLNQRVGRVLTKKKGDELFFLYFLSIHLKAIEEKTARTTVKHLSHSVVEKINEPLPKPQEQQKIATCLSSLDEVIAAHSQKLELLKDHKKGLMQNLFPQEGEKVPKYRFKEFEKDGEWVSHKIGDFIESHKGGAPLTPSDFVDKSDFEVIPKKAINEGGLLNMSVSSPTYCTENFYNNNKKSVVDTSFLITTLRDLVPSGPSIGYIVKFNGIKKYILAQGVYGLKPKNTIVPDFLIQFSNTIRYRKLVNAAMVGSTQVHIRNSEFLNLPIQAPKKQEQQKIASCLSSLDALITAKTEKIEQLKLHKKGLMQGLFPKIND